MSDQSEFDEAFKIYLEKFGKEPEDQICDAIAAKVQSTQDARLLFDKIQSVKPDAYQIMLLYAFGKIDMETARERLLQKHPFLSPQSLEKATGFGLFLVH